MNEITVCTCRPGDAADLWQFRERALGRLGIFEHMAKSFSSEAEIREFLFDNSCCVNHSRVAAAVRYGREIVGLGVVAVESRDPPIAEIAGYVLPEHRGLIDASRTFLMWAFVAFPGFRFTASTRAFNAPALQALKSAGFKVVETDRGDVMFSR